jgi:hypothetical protein
VARGWPPAGVGAMAGRGGCGLPSAGKAHGQGVRAASYRWRGGSWWSMAPQAHNGLGSPAGHEGWKPPVWRGRADCVLVST